MPLEEAEPKPHAEPEPTEPSEPDRNTSRSPNPRRCASRYAAAIPPLVVVPPAPPEPEPEAVPTPNVVELRPAEPREWNVWELERRAREQAGVDAARDREWGYLLLYLREFASAEGTLPGTSTRSSASRSAS